MEEWKPIEGYEGLYEVSNLGQVRSFYSGEAKILKPWVNKDGYLKVTLSKNGKQCNKTIHRLVAKAFIPNLENKPQVNHIDGNKQNNAVSNLEWCTSLENIQHAWNTGLSRMTKERKKKLSESHKGKYPTEETKNKMSEAHKGEKHPMYGKHHTEETRKKLSKALKGEKNPRARKVICITTGETFNCILEAEKKYNVANQSISKCCKGKIKSAGKHPVTGEKLVWEYIKGVI